MKIERLKVFAFFLVVGMLVGCAPIRNERCMDDMATEICRERGYDFGVGGQGSAICSAKGIDSSDYVAFTQEELRSCEKEDFPKSRPDTEMRWMKCGVPDGS